MRLEIELDPLVTGAFTVPTIVGHEILVFTEKKQFLRHEGPHPAEKLVGKRESPYFLSVTPIPFTWKMYPFKTHAQNHRSVTVTSTSRVPPLCAKASR